MKTTKRQSESCMKPGLLLDFATGKLKDPKKQIQSEEHIESCEKCLHAIKEFSRCADPFINGIRRIAGFADIAPVVPSSTEDEKAPQRIYSIVESSIDISQGWTDAEAQDTRQCISTRSRRIEAELARLSQIGPYRLVRKIAEGGMGIVYEAIHQKMNRRVALKLHPTSRLGSHISSQLFEREIRTIARLSHPNIVAAYDAGDENGYLFIAMELLIGTDLSAITHHRKSTMPPNIATEITRQAALGLGHIHSQHLVHRDIKPANIMICSDPQHVGDVTVKLLDVGLARNTTSDGQDSVSCVEQVMGTIEYMSPEQCLDSRDADARSDIFSLGATLFKMLTGQTPLASFGCQTLGQKIKVLLCNDMPKVESVQPHLPREIAAIVDRMLCTNRNDRFQNANELSDALERFGQGTDLVTFFQESQASRAST